VPADRPSAPTLRHLATQLRIDSILSTSEAGSGHPTSCCSAAEIVATLFFGEMRFDPLRPRHPGNDRFVLSKGHAAPILYAAWAAAGAFDRAELLRLRQFASDLEGHPTPRLSFVDVATGSLGQGICAGVGLALNARRIGSACRTYVLLGDGEMAEGSVWEAAHASVHHRLDNLCVIVDVNRFGQAGETQWNHAVDRVASHWRGFGWDTVTVDGHDVEALLDAYARARDTRGRPTAIVARTLKGKGVSIFEGKPGWHGKALKKGPELDRALAELEAQRVDAPGPPPIPPPRDPAPREPEPAAGEIAPPAYGPGDRIATREAFGKALAALGAVDGRVVALDADVKNSTFSEYFERAFPDRFYQMFIAEQVMIGAAMGLASQGAIPFPSTFACFLTRAYDFIRMAGISQVNVKLAGSHAGVSIGEDGPSQMGLEDLAMMRAVPNCVVLYPCDGVSTERLVVAMARHRGLAYMRTSRPKTPILYTAADAFAIGGSKVLRASPGDVATVVAAGVTVFEALRAHEALAREGLAIGVVDAYSVQPLDEATIVRAGRASGVLITVEDHYAAGGLGDAVADAAGRAGVPVVRLAVREIPRSGTPDELLDHFGLSARHIVAAVRRIRASRDDVPAGRHA
jgi:transketolase